MSTLNLKDAFTEYEFIYQIDFSAPSSMQNFFSYTYYIEFILELYSYSFHVSLSYYESIT